MALDPRYAYRRGIITCDGPTSLHYAPVMAALAGFGPRGARWEAEFRTDRTGTTTLQVGLVSRADRDDLTALQYMGLVRAPPRRPIGRRNAAGRASREIRTRKA